MTRAALPLPPGVPPSHAAKVAGGLNSAAIRLLRRISRDDAADGLTGARASALSVVVYGGARTVGELARREGVSPPTMTRIVDALVREGLLRREADPRDRRSLLLTPTARGRRLMELGRARRIRRLAMELSSLPPRQLRTLERAVEILRGLEGADAKEGRDGRR
jgi:DNA-binding MarR family transcriptional regulator